MTLILSETFLARLELTPSMKSIQKTWNITEIVMDIKIQNNALLPEDFLAERGVVHKECK